VSRNKQSMGIRDNNARVTAASSLKAAPTAGGVTAPGALAFVTVAAAKQGREVQVRFEFGYPAKANSEGTPR
jgi:hypothetical protein